MLHKIFKGIAPIAALAFGATLTGCDGVNIRIGDEEGVPLSELDMSGEAPTAVAMLGPDTVIITEGKVLDIDVEGDQAVVDAIRFSLDDDTLGVMRDNDFRNEKGRAIIRVTMPAPRELSMAGSGRIEAASMAGDAEVNMAGSGAIALDNISAKALEVNMAGSGTISGSGNTERLELNILGSGEVKMDGLTTGEAEISIAGSGRAAFASDGKVEANIAGSGTVRVIGRATCEVHAMGSGKVICETGNAQADTGAKSGDAGKATDKKVAKKAAKSAKRVAKASKPKGKGKSSGPANA